MELKFSILPVMSPESEPRKTQHPLNDSGVQLQVDEEDLQRQQTCLHDWNRLQGEIQQLHELFVEFNKVVHVSV